MFGLGGGELFIVLLLAALFIGPKDLPRVATRLGRYYRRFKDAADDLKETIEKEVDLSDEAKPSDKFP